MMRKDCLFVVCALSFLAAGCFQPRPYGYPAAYGPPPYTAMAPQPMLPGSTAPGAVWVPATPMAPAGAAASGAAPKPGQPAKPTDAFQEPQTGNSVPEPRDPNRRAPETSSDSFGLDDQTMLERRGLRTSLQTVQPRRRASASLPAPVADSLDLAEPEIAATTDVESSDSDLRTADFSTKVRSGNVTPAANLADIYGYDKQDHAWLKGRVEYDRATQTWHLIYNTTPDENDPFGGEVTFQRAAYLQVLKPREAVQVEGHFHEIERDRLGKPVYVIERLIRAAKAQ